MTIHQGGISDRDTDISYKVFFSISAVVKKVDHEETSVTLCQVHVKYDQSYEFDDRALLSLLATLKMHDFQIGQPVWGSSDALLYLCEHRLKTGLKQSIIDQELNKAIKNNGASAKRVAWSCA
jgi:hypothetical protein